MQNVLKECFQSSFKARVRENNERPELLTREVDVQTAKKSQLLVLRIVTLPIDQVWDGKFSAPTSPPMLFFDGENWFDQVF